MPPHNYVAVLLACMVPFAHAGPEDYAQTSCEMISNQSLQIRFQTLEGVPRTIYVDNQAASRIAYSGTIKGQTGLDKIQRIVLLSPSANPTIGMLEFRFRDAGVLRFGWLGVACWEKLNAALQSKVELRVLSGA
jgi:hypothetical protein